jgi:polyphosphate glucokinase
MTPMSPAWPRCAFGAGRDQNGVVFIITIGTGLGTALFTNGVLVPNTELGHIEMDGQDAEWQASDAARQRDGLKWREWALRFDRYLGRLDALFWPDLFILGGGASKKMKKFQDILSVNAKIVPAELRNDAGIVGAAIAAEVLATDALGPSRSRDSARRGDSSTVAPPSLVH